MVIVYDICRKVKKGAKKGLIETKTFQKEVKGTANDLNLLFVVQDVIKKEHPGWYLLAFYELPTS